MVSHTQRAIALLMDMAEQGEINPWDVQVVAVIDRFLAELDLETPSLNSPPDPNPGHSSALYESNLSASGQAFLYASMLVLLKADTLAQMDQETENLDEEDLPLEAWEDNDRLESGLPKNLERHLKRRAVAHPPLQRPVTLGDLVEQLELMATALETRAPHPKPRRPKRPSAKQASQAINQLSQQENPAAIVDQLGQFLEEHWSNLVTSDPWLDFETLVRAWQDHLALVQAIVPKPPPDRVGIFWALLLLAAQSRCELRQSDFYGTLHLRVLTPQPLTRPDHSSNLVPFPIAASS